MSSLQTLLKSIFSINMYSIEARSSGDYTDYEISLEKYLVVGKLVPVPEALKEGS